MKERFFKLLTLGLCISTIIPTLAFATVPSEASGRTRTSTPSEAIGEEELLTDVPNIATQSVAVQSEKTFLDYFPDPNFAQGIAEVLDKDKEDYVTERMLASIKKLDLWKCNIQNIEGIEYLTNLESLNLMQNQIETLPDSLGNLSNLQVLYLSNNQIKKLPESFSNLTNLHRVDLCVNQLTELPASLNNLSKLFEIDLTYNKLTEKVPEDSLRILYLRAHEFTIPNSPYMASTSWQEGILDPITVEKGSQITADMLVSPFIKQLISFSITEGTLSGIWNITDPSGNIVTIPAGNGSEINSSLFTESGAYEVTFRWYKSITVSDIILERINSTITVNVVEEQTPSAHNVTVTTQYQDAFLPDTTQTTQIQHKDAYLQTYEIADGYQIANLDQLPSDVIVDQDQRTISISSVTQDYHIALEFEKTPCEVSIRIVYEDGSREDQVSTYTVPYGERFETDFMIDDNYNINFIKFRSNEISVNILQRKITINQVNKSIEVTISVI